MRKLLSLLLCSLLICMNILMCTAYANDTCDCVKVEHLQLPKKLAKRTPVDTVNLTSQQAEILPYNTLEVAFAQDFNGKFAQVGDEVVFILPECLTTCEGSVILPESTKIIAQICDIECPKAFNRSGKIYLNFKYIEFPDGSRQDINAKLFNKKDFLSRGKLNALGKGLGSTLGGMGVGTAAGCGIGIAANAVIVGGFAIGMPIGFAIGASAGLITPGLHYKAKAGDKINIQLLDNIIIEK